jgi:hypothetical protein
VRRHLLIALLLLAVSAAHGGCSEDFTYTPLKLNVVALSGTCETTRKTEKVSTLKGQLLRLTVLQRPAGSSAQSALFCDQLVDLSSGAGQAQLALSPTTGDKGRVDLLVEVFSKGPPPALIASGVLPGLDLYPPRQRDLELLLVQPARFSCTPAPQASPRAFHTATALPNGQVLLVGGLTQPGQSGGTGLRIDHSIEVYEPRTGTFKRVGGDLPEGRAFHSATLLTSPAAGPYDLMLVGGLAAPTTQPTEPVVKLGLAGDPLPLVPTAIAAQASSVVLRYFPWTDPPQVQQLKASPKLTGRIFHTQASTTGGQAVVLGGLDAISAGRLTTQDTLEVLTSDTKTEHDGPYALQRARVGAAAAPLGTDKLLVFGGNLDSSAGKQGAEAAEIVSLMPSPASALATVEFGSASRVKPVAFGSLTPLSGGDLLLVGGLEVDQGAAKTPRTTGTVQRLNLVGSSLRVTDVAAAIFTPVAFHAAQTLRSGEVLLTGGMSAVGTCPVGVACDRAYRYDPTGAQLKLIDTMRTGRLGHRVSQLAGDQLLLSGGLQITGTTLKALSAAELFSTAGEGGDPYGRVAGKASTSPCSTE